MNVLRHILTPHSVRNGKFWLREKVLDWIFFVWIVSGIFYCLRVEAYLWKVAKTRKNFHILTKNDIILNRKTSQNNVKVTAF